MENSASAIVVENWQVMDVEIPPSSVGKGQRTLNWRNAVLVGHENQMEECRCPKVSSSRSPPFEGRQESIFVLGIFAICFLKSRKQMSTLRTRCVRMVSIVSLGRGEVLGGSP